MSAVLTPPRWADEDLLAFVRDRVVTTRDRDGGTVRLPGWLLAAAAAESTLSAVDALAATHPDDQAALIEAFGQAVAQPGVPRPVRVRARFGGAWAYHDLTWLNLLDDDRVGAVLCTRDTNTGPAVPDPGPQPGPARGTGAWLVMTLETTGIIAAVEGPVERILGYRAADMVGRSAAAFVHPDGLASIVANWLELVDRPGATRASERRWIRADGSEVWCRSSYFYHDGPSGPGVLAVFEDITERIRRDEELAARAEELRVMTEQRRALVDNLSVLANQVPTPVLRCDAAGRVEFHNDRWALVAPGATHLHAVVAPADHDALDEALAAAAAGEERVVEVSGSDGSSVWLARLRGSGAGSGRVIGSITDITDAARFRREARRDHLTGVLNRATFDERLTALLAEQAGSTMVVFVDLDGFKSVNDTLGHDAGDALLAEVARRLAAAVRPEDLVGRYGGDEFVVVLAGADALDEAGAAARIERALGGPVDLDPPGGGNAPVAWQPRASVGAVRARPGDDLAAVVGRADHAMLAVKRTRSAGRR